MKLLALTAVLSFSLPSLKAANVYWDGITSSWADVQNWIVLAGDPPVFAPYNMLPTSGDFVYFDGYATGPNFPTTLGDNRTVEGVIFQDMEFDLPIVVGSLSDPYVLTLQGDGGLSLKLQGTNDWPVGADATLNFNINLLGTVPNAPQQWEVVTSKVLTTAGNVTLNTSLTLTDEPIVAAFNSGGSFVIGSAGKVLLNSGGDRTLTVQDTGAVTELTVNGDIHLTEGTDARRFTLNAATADVGVIINGDILNGGAGASAFTRTGLGTVTINGDLAYTSTAASGTATSGTIFTGAGTTTLNGNVTNGGATAAHNVAITTAGTTVNIGGSGNTVSTISVDGLQRGTWLVNAGTTLNFTGTTALATGTWDLRGGAAVNVASTAVLTGSSGNWGIGSGGASVAPKININGQMGTSAASRFTVGTVTLGNTSAASPDSELNFNSTANVFLTTGNWSINDGGVLKIAGTADIVSGTWGVNDNSTINISGAATLNTGLVTIGAGLVDWSTGTGSATMAGFTLGGAATGTAAEVKFNSGVVVALTGNITSRIGSGSLLITGGTLNLGAARTISVGNNAAADDLIITSALGNGSGTGSVIKTGAGTVVMSGANTYTGTTTISAGTVALNYATQNNSKLADSAALNLEGGILELRGNAAGSVENIGNIDLTAAAITTPLSSLITLAPNGALLTLNAGLITGGSTSRTLHFVIPSNARVTTTSANTGFVGAWATMNNGVTDNFAAIIGGEIASATSAVVQVPGVWASTLVNQNVSFGSGDTGTSDYMNVNSLRLGGGTLNVLENLNIQSGGILTPGDAGPTSITGGTLTATTNLLLFNHLGSQALTVNSSIQAFNNSSVVGTTGVVINKIGTGTVVLAGVNVTGERGTPTTASGTVNINNGTLAVTGGNAISNNTAVTLQSASSVLRVDANETIGNLTGTAGTVNLQSNTLTLRQNGGTYAGTLVGDANSKLIRNNQVLGTSISYTASTGANTLTTNNFSISSVNDQFLGTLQVDGGLTIITGSFNSAARVAVNKSGSVLLDGGPSTRIGDATQIVLTSANGASNNNNALLRGFWLRNGTVTPSSETVGQMVLGGGSSYIVNEANTGSGTTTVVTLIMAGLTRENNSTLAVRGTRLGFTPTTAARSTILVSTTGDADEAFGNQFRVGVGSGAYANGGTAVGAQTVAGADNISIIPYMLGESLSGVQDPIVAPGQSFVTYDASYSGGTNLGFRALHLTTEYADYSTAGTTDNVRISSAAAVALGAGKTINSLIINNANTTNVGITATGTGTLDVTSGAFLFTSVGAVDATLGNATANATSGNITLTVDSITVGGPNKEYIMYANNPLVAGVTINANLTTVAKFTKSGIGLLHLNGANAALTDVTINEGLLSVSNLASLGGADGTINFGGGTLLLGATYNNDSLASRTINVYDGTDGRIQIAAGKDVTIGTVNALNTDFIKAGSGIMRLGAGSVINAERFIVENNLETTTASPSTPQLVLNNTTGVAINGNLQIGSGIDNRSTAVVHLLANEQIVDTGVISFNASSSASRFAYLNLLGHTETVAGIESGDGGVAAVGGAMIQNADVSNNVAGAQGNLILSGSGDYYYGGRIQNFSGAGSTANQGILAITKAGTGTQTLAGEFISYTGTTTISGGLLRLRNTVALQSSIVNNATLEIERTKDADWTYNGVISGNGNVRKTGASGVTNGFTILTAANTYSGTTDIEAGSLSLSATGTIDNSRAISIKSGATFGVSAKLAAGYNYGHILSGEGTVNGTITLLNGGSLRPGASTNPLVDATTGNQMGQLTITAGSFGLNNSTALLQIGKATTNDVGITTAYENNTLAAYISSQATTWNALSVNDASGAPQHDSINIGGSFTWSNGGLITYQAVDGYVPAAGDVYDLWDWVGVGATFTSVSTGADGNNQRIGGTLGNLELPELQGGLFYDLSQFQQYGIIVVAGAVPEPSRVLMLVIAAGLLVMRRRRA